MGASLEPRNGLLRRDQVLAFVIERIASTRTSPSVKEISRALGISETRVKQLIAQLVKHGAITKTPGGVRSLRVCDVSGSRDLLDQALRHLGWTTAMALGELQDPYLTGQLQMFPPFEHLPDVD